MKSWKKLLLVGLIITSVGCAGQRPRPEMPAKPNLSSQFVQFDDGSYLCFEHDSAVKLGRYIMDLEGIYSR